MRAPRLGSEQGFTIIEVLVAAFVLLVGVMGAVALIDGANATTSRTKAREAGTGLTREVLEDAHSIPYAHLTPTELVPLLQVQQGLGDADLSSGGWQVKRRGVVYTITTSVCSMDDPADGTGPHDAGTFCADSPGGSNGTTPILDFGGTVGGTSVDGSIGLGGGTPDDYKRLVVTATWGAGTLKQVSQTSLINNPGNSAGPAITLFAAAGLSSSTITTVTTSVNFTLTTSLAPAGVKWSVDGTVQGNALGAGTAWNFTWLTGSTVVDGTYLITAQAYDANGLSGSARSLAMTLNRYAPQAPQGFLAGRNGSIVDFEWLANPERDIIGYRVYRQPLIGSRVLVCSTTGATGCHYTYGALDLPGTYYVVALDKDASGSTREGAQSLPAVVTTLNIRPNPPTNLVASTSNGSTILSWHAPLIGDLDGYVAFYRIYRDGSTYADRYDRTGSGAELTYTDRKTGGTSHQYWITAVDNQLAESTIVGPVTQ